jgi:Xaa-Pro aminopeptidase
LTECQIDEELTARRAAQAGFIELSFPTIAGANSNGAIIHYRPLPETCATVDSTTLLLLDSGGQYDCGTTDITRTMHMGTPSEHQCTAFTAVLKGHIGLDVAIWPEGTPGCALDTLARTALWRLGLNYRHGTGHGVGAALNVHEGPQSIAPRFWNTTPLLPNMVCSNEPGYYEDGAFGVRIENLFVIVPAETEHKFAGEYYTCDRLTVCPLQKKMIVKKDLTSDEIAWVDQYHQHVYKVLAPRLEAEGCNEELEWLKNATSPL